VGPLNQNGVLTLPADSKQSICQPCVSSDVYKRLKRGDKLPPVRVRFDGKSYWLEDGFHRLEAVRKIGLKTIAAKVIPGTLAEMEGKRLGKYTVDGIG
jgi:hypothetical protein